MKRNSSNSLTRRSLLKHSSAVVGGGSLLLAAKPFAAAYGETPAQVEGPFHPVNRDTDLTRKDAGSPLATGQIHYVHGRVVDDKSQQPLANVIVELWQADVSGYYDHPADPRAGDRDEHFQYWGRAVTDAAGAFLFKTIKPGSYPAEPGWDRPPHLHFRFLRRGYHELTTQMYFADEPELNAADRLLSALTKAEQAQLIVTFKDTPNRESGAREGLFIVELKQVK